MLSSQRDVYTIESYTELYTNIYTCPTQINYNTYTTSSVKLTKRHRILLVIIPNGNLSCRDIPLCFWRSRVFPTGKTAGQCGMAVFIFPKVNSSGLDLFSISLMRTYFPTGNRHYWLVC